ncbi:NAD(P)H-binding protein [Rhizobium sp. TH2]|uniref:NAD(P)H-binding protein n=1 Tax=Rhizobium sp. TH2 TaxID=2775403 RepID=UPI00215767DA|nr:NAD(P)H-binding protein [Rhizobium sp. TH2]
MTMVGNSVGNILVLGANGKTGRRIVERLRNLDAPIRIGSRKAPIPFDWENHTTWKPALDGVSTVYVTFQPDIAVPGALETVSKFYDTAIASGTAKFILLSGRGEVEAEDAERVLQATNADWTILRASWFAQNFSESFFLEPIRQGEVFLPTGLAAEPFVDADDLADMAVAAIMTSDHSRVLYDITGPEALTFEDAVGRIARATGREISFTTVRPEAYRDELVRMEVPREYVELIMYLFANVLDGRNTPVTDAVQRALGRPAGSFDEYVARTAATGIWGGNNV